MEDESIIEEVATVFVEQSLELFGYAENDKILWLTSNCETPSPSKNFLEVALVTVAVTAYIYQAMMQNI